MTDWRVTTLGDVADLLVGYAFKSASFSDNRQDVRLLRGVNISQGTIDWSRSAYLPSAEVRSSSTYRLEDGDVVLAMDRPWIEAGLKRSRLRQRDLPALLVQRVTRLRGTRDLRTSFIHHLLATEGFSKYIQGIVTGATVPHISQSQISAYRFPLPPIEEQDRICNILDSVEDLVENNRRRSELLEQMAQEIYREWFLRFRYPGHKDAAFVESSVGPVPDGWAVRTIGALGTVVTGSTPSTKTSTYWGTTGDVPFLTPSEMSMHRLWAEPDRFLSPEGVLSVRTRLLPAGAVCFACIGSIGKTAMTMESTVTNQQVNSVVVDETISTSAYVFHALSDAAESIRATASGAATPIINRSAFVATRLLVPSRAMSQRFAEVINPIHKAIVTSELQNRNLAHIRDLLLPKLVSGQIDVSTLDLDAVVGSVA